MMQPLDTDTYGLGDCLLAINGQALGLLSIGARRLPLAYKVHEDSEDGT
jgi:hypothetical protein